MSSSCSSENNGCANCAPNLSLWTIGSSISQSKFGHGCLNGEEGGPFLNASTTSMLSINGSESLICGKQSVSCNYSSTSRYNYGVDNYGQIFVGINSNLNYSYNSFFTDGCGTCSPPNQSSSSDLYFSTTISKRNACEQDTTTSSDNLGPPNLCIIPCDAPGCSNSYSCEQVINNESNSYSFYGTFTPFPPCTNCNGNVVPCQPPFSYSVINNTNGNIISSVSSLLTLEMVYNLCKSATSTKISLLENNDPQNCNGDTCGSGKDDCWGSASSFSIEDNNLDDPNAVITTSQKLKFKIAVLKEGFDKKYKSISGRVIFYYGGTGGKTPCCDDDFDGTVVEERSYSISASSIFKDNYFAVDCGEFDNDDQSLVGETINICYTVDNIQFI